MPCINLKIQQISKIRIKVWKISEWVLSNLTLRNAKVRVSRPCCNLPNQEKNQYWNVMWLKNSTFKCMRQNRDTANARAVSKWEASIIPIDLTPRPFCRNNLHRSNFGFSISRIPAAQVGSAVGKPIHKPKIDFYDLFSLYLSDLYDDTLWVELVFCSHINIAVLNKEWAVKESLPK